MADVLMLAVVAALAYGFVMMVCALLLMMWPILLAAAIAYPTYRIVTKRLAVRRERQAELRANAEHEHRQIMNGDYRGYFGRYPPAVTPPFLTDDNEWHVS